MPRRTAAIPLLVVLLFGFVGSADIASAADRTAAESKPAITVNTTEYSTGQLVDELRKLADNPRLVRYFKSQGGKLVPKKGTIDAGTAWNWVNELVHLALVNRELKRLNLSTAGVDARASEAQVHRAFGGAKVFAAFPKAFRKKLIARQMRIDALRASFPPTPAPTEAQLREVLTRLQTQCPDGKLLSQIWSRKKSDADKIHQELEQGADFATLARARSDEKASGARGGILTCVGTPGFKAYPKKYRTAATNLPVGDVSQLVPAFGGYFILKTSPLTYENALPLLQSQHRGAQADPLNTLFIEQTNAADPFRVSKRFATIIRTENDVAMVPNVKPVKLSS